MTIPVYKFEQAEGLQDLILKDTSIAYVSLAQPSMVTKADEAKAQFLVAKAKANPNQFDLYYMHSVLASIGWNKNDDVFDKIATWKARNTPVDKQFNLMHDEANIIGHITSSVVLDYDGNIIPDDTPESEIPDQYDIVVGTVLYKYWQNAERQQRMVDIIEGIEAGQYFVSMECLFKDFDYAVISPDGVQSVIPRTEASAFLTKHLRRYGGSGQYEGYTIGRYLKDFTFSGEGLVENPANERSIIFNGVSLFSGATASTNILTKPEGQIQMSTANTNDNTVVAKLEQEIANLKTENKQLAEKEKAAAEAAVKAQLDEANKKAQAAADAQKAAEDKAKASEEQLAKANETLEKVKAELEESKKAVANLTAEKVTAQRLSKLATAGVEAEKAAELVEKWSKADEAQFDDVVALYAEMKKSDKDKKAKDDEEKKKAEAAKAAAELAAANSGLDSAELEQDANLNTVDENAQAELQKSVANWISSNVLTTTFKK